MTNTLWFHLCGVVRIVKTIQTESRMVVGKGKEDKEMGVLFNEYKFCKMKRFLEIGIGSDDCYNMN